MKQVDTGSRISRPADQLLDPDVIEQTYVAATYEQIAPHFSNTRYGCWPQIRSFLEDLSPGSVVLDLGCGNGKYSRCCLDRDVQWIGLDNCTELLAIASEKSCRESECTESSGEGSRKRHVLECVAGSCLGLPFRTGAADVCICIAVLHHLASEERRLKVLNEALRCLKPGGMLLLYVWALEQVQGSIGARMFSTADVLVPWQRSSSKTDKVPPVYRYYHVFARSEFERLLAQCTGCRVLSVEFDSNNWSAQVQKDPAAEGEAGSVPCAALPVATGIQGTYEPDVSKKCEPSSKVFC